MKKKSYAMINAAKYKAENPNSSIMSIAKQFGVDRGALTKALDDYLLYTIDGNDGFYYYFTKEELSIVEYFMEHPHISIEELKRVFNTSMKSDTLKRWIKILGYEYKTHHKYNNNQNAFDKIRTEEDAYWLGFITADGYVNETNNWLQIGVGEIDLLHLKKFLKYLDFQENEMDEIIKRRTGGAYTKDNIVYSITICGKQLVNNLKQYNLFQGKSGKEIPYKCATPELEKAYIRGMLDGDGYIRSTEFGVGIVGSLQMLEYIRNYLHIYLNIDNEKYIHPHGTIYKFAVGGKNISKQILDFLYKDATIYLNRKYDLYKQYCRA